MTEKDNGIKTTEYLITIAVFVFAVIGCMFYENVFSSATVSELMQNIANSLTIPGAVFFGVGTLSWVASKGGYNSIGYMFSKFSLHNILPTKPMDADKPKESYYDYTVRKQNSRKGWLKHVFLTGLAGLVLSVIFIFVSYLT